MSHDDAAGAGAGEVAAGPFHTWLTAIGRSLREGSPMNVPCGHCTACCRSAQFVHVGAEETETLARIPPELLFPAPGRPGEHVLGYHADGHCPLLVGTGRETACSIYDHRPRACRSYDCRVFAAAGLDPAADGKHAIAERTRRWRFSYRDPIDRERHRQIMTAAREASARGPSTVTERALIAVREVSG